LTARLHSFSLSSSETPPARSRSRNASAAP
jgi:hypothetical protein